MDHSFPGPGHLAAPPLPGGTEVGTQLPGVLQAGDAVALGERELLGHVRHGPANQPETDPVRPVEGDRLQRGGSEQATVNGGVVLGENHTFSRSTTRSLPAMARGVRPRYGAAITSNTVSAGAATSTLNGPRGRTRRPQPVSIASLPVTTR